MIRRPAVADVFYPASDTALRAQIEGLLPRTEAQTEAIAVVVPHAGYLYSGAARITAAWGRERPS
jgi:hypothetical protein